MARTIGAGGTLGHRASGALALHVLDAMLATAESMTTGTFVEITSTFPPVPPLPESWDPTAAII